MKKFSKKSVSLVLVFIILMTIFIPSIVNAETYPTRIEKVDNISKESSVYAGEIFVDGTSQMTWLYSSNISNYAATFDNLKASLTGTAFANLVPTLDADSDTNGLAVSSSHQSDMSSSWTSASYVANQYYTGTVGTETNSNLYDVNNTYKSNVDNQEASHQEEMTTPIDFNKRFFSTISVASDYEMVTENEVLTKVITVTFNEEATTVNYTRVDVTTETTPATPTKINTLNIGIASPKVGDTATATTKPTVTLDSNPNYEIDHIAYITDYPSEKPLGEYDAPFTGTFEADKDYVVEVSLVAKDGFAFVDNNGMTLKVNGKTTGFENSEWNADGSTYYMFFAKVQATAEEETTPTTYEFIANTANQTYTINEDDALTFRINADFSLFENGGKVYVDGTETKEFTASSGSTIITFAKEYVSSLSEGEHTLKVAFNNGGEATTKFTIAKANTTAEETTPTTTTETETTSNNPKTGDNIAIWISLMVVSMLGVAGTIKYTKKRK